MNKKDEGAAWYYHHPDYGFNCAQSIVFHYAGGTPEVESMKNKGSGRAPHGYCGALHAGLYLLENAPEAQKILIDFFTQKAGSPVCRQIRKEGQTSCRACVAIVDNALKIILSEKFSAHEPQKQKRED